MKIVKVQCCLALCAAFTISTPAFSQTSVTIYGVADVYGEVSKGDKSQTGINSGGLSGSRLGFKATQDFSNGLSALAKFEAGVGADSGTSTQGGRTWGRQTFVGLSGGFGTVTVGRQYTPTFNALDSDDPFETGAGSGISSGIVSIIGGTRADNSLVWEMPKMGDISANVMYAAGESTTGSNSNGNFVGANVRYASGPLGIGLTLGHQNRADDPGTAASSALLAGTYDFGAFSLMAGVQAVKNLTRATATDDDRTEYFLGTHIPVGNDAVWLGAASGSTKGVSGTRATQLSAGYLHALFKNTTLYGVLTNIHNGDATAYTADTATGSGPAVSPGKKVNALQVGVRFKF